MFNELGDLFKSINDTYSKEMELAAIWYHRPIQTATERTVRLCEGHLIRIENDVIVDCEENKPATHKIICCTGTITSSNLQIHIISLSDNQPLTIKLN